MGLWGGGGMKAEVKQEQRGTDLLSIGHDVQVALAAGVRQALHIHFL